MAGGTRPVMLTSLVLGLLIVLFAGFTSSEFTLTLALGGLFATGIGLVMLMKPSQQIGSKMEASLVPVNDGGSSETPYAGESLPDPLSIGLDRPL